MAKSIRSVKTQLTGLERVQRILIRGPLRTDQIAVRIGMTTSRTAEILKDNPLLFECLRKKMLGSIDGSALWGLK